MIISFCCENKAVQKALAKHCQLCNVEIDVYGDREAANGAIAALLVALGIDCEEGDNWEAQISAEDCGSSGVTGQFRVRLELSPDDVTLGQCGKEQAQQTRRWFLASAKKLQKELGVTSG